MPTMYYGSELCQGSYPVMTRVGRQSAVHPKESNKIAIREACEPRTSSRL